MRIDCDKLFHKTIFSLFFQKNKTILFFFIFSRKGKTKLSITCTRNKCFIRKHIYFEERKKTEKRKSTNIYKSAFLHA